MRNLPAKWRPKVTTIHEANDFNKLSIENLISSLKNYEMELIGDEPPKKFKLIAMKSSGKYA